MHSTRPGFFIHPARLELTGKKCLDLSPVRLYLGDRTGFTVSSRIAPTTRIDINPRIPQIGEKDATKKVQAAGAKKLTARPVVA